MARCSQPVTVAQARSAGVARQRPVPLRDQVLRHPRIASIRERCLAVVVVPRAIRATAGRASGRSHRKPLPVMPPSTDGNAGGERASEWRSGTSGGRCVPTVVVRARSGPPGPLPSSSLRAHFAQRRVPVTFRKCSRPARRSPPGAARVAAVRIASSTPRYRRRTPAPRSSRSLPSSWAARCTRSKPARTSGHSSPVRCSPLSTICFSFCSSAGSPLFPRHPRGWRRRRSGARAASTRWRPAAAFRRR